MVDLIDVKSVLDQVKLHCFDFKGDFKVEVFE